MSQPLAHTTSRRRLLAAEDLVKAGFPYAGWQALPQDAARASELLAALSADQQSVAIIGTSRPATSSPGQAGRPA